MKIDGRCHCGFIAFEAEAELGSPPICHCTDCQSLSAFRSVVLTQEGSCRLRSGAPQLYVKTGDNGSKRAQAFCPKCGSPIYSTTVEEGPKVHSIRLGIVRQRDQFVPKLQLWFRSAQHWVTDLN